jgi:hypothetical protein
MEFEWDENKRLANIRKHGIDFLDIPLVFDGFTVTVEDNRASTEQRFITFGLLQGRVVTVVHTEREDRIRIISARKATKYEERSYFEQISD